MLDALGVRQFMVRPMSDDGVLDELIGSERPESYFRPRTEEQFLVARATKAVDRARVKAVLASSEPGSPTVPTARIGEALPDLERSEVEIARISLLFANPEIVSVYARRCKGRIRYRVVDELDGTLVRNLDWESSQPLTLAELVALIREAWNFPQCVNLQFGQDLNRALAGLAAESCFYADLQAMCRQRVREEWPEPELEPEDYGHVGATRKAHYPQLGCPDFSPDELVKGMLVCEPLAEDIEGLYSRIRENLTFEWRVERGRKKPIARRLAGLRRRLREPVVANQREACLEWVSGLSGVEFELMLQPRVEAWLSAPPEWPEPGVPMQEGDDEIRLVSWGETDEFGALADICDS